MLLCPIIFKPRICCSILTYQSFQGEILIFKYFQNYLQIKYHLKQINIWTKFRSNLLFQIIPSLQDFVKNSPSPYHAVKQSLDLLKANGFKLIKETDNFPKEPFCYNRDALSVVAVIPGKDLNKGFNSVQSHVDSPVLKIQQIGKCKVQGELLVVPCEPYSGPVLSRWLDRSLQIAGRVIYSKNGHPVPLLFKAEERAYLPSLAPHMLRGTDKTDWIPSGDGDYVICLPFDETKMFDGMTTDDLIKVLAHLDKDVKILSQNIDISVDQQEVLGNKLLISSRLDNLASVYCNLCAIIENVKQPQPEVTQILYAFNNEEVGSLTRAGAQGPSIINLWSRIYSNATQDQLFSSLARSYVASCDGAHGNHPVKGAGACQDPVPVLGKGFCIKQGQKQNYSFVDSCVATAMQLCMNHNLAVQQFIGKPYKQGGGTIGNFVAAQADLNVLDCGVPMTGMHSCGECISLSDAKVFIEFSKYVLLEGNQILEEIKSVE